MYTGWNVVYAISAWTRATLKARCHLTASQAVSYVATTVHTEIKSPKNLIAGDQVLPISGGLYVECMYLVRCDYASAAAWRSLLHIGRMLSPDRGRC